MHSITIRLLPCSDPIFHVLLIPVITADARDILASSTESIGLVLFLSGDGLRGEEKIPEISSIPFASRGRGSNMTPVRLND